LLYDGNEKQMDETFLQFFSNNVTIYFYMFCTLMKHWICCNVSCWVIVTI